MAFSLLQSSFLDVPSCFIPLYPPSDQRFTTFSLSFITSVASLFHNVPPFLLAGSELGSIPYFSNTGSVIGVALRSPEGLPFPEGCGAWGIVWKMR